ncbi:MAG TPA: GH92 family glycosyl hydrolase [Flavilitoribacter sp.]|nr:GH92 family glycosyl hydrolase [Flavilitoribacter sp.]
MIKYRFVLIGLVGCFLACNRLETTANEQTERPVDLVYPLLDAANSRWFFFNSATRPFGMVNLSPDTQTDGAWGSGYRYDTDTIRGFSHIHAWQMAGLSVMPVIFEEGREETILADHSSPFDHGKEAVEAGYHAVQLERFGIRAELTSTTRAGFHRYAFQNPGSKGLVIDLGGRLGPSDMVNGTAEQDGEKALYGRVDNAPTRRRPKPVTVFFYMQLDQPTDGVMPDSAGKFLVLLRPSGADTLKMKVGLSYTSVENARLNLETELPDWDFDRVVGEAKSEWDGLLSRIRVEGGTNTDRRRFYTDLWHALQGRRIISDVNGAYPDNTGAVFRIGQLPLDAGGNPRFNHYNSDSFWGAQWTLNTLWGLMYPEIYAEFVNSLLVYYRDGGLIPRGPSGGNYTNVMTGASSTPFIVSAWQKGIRGFDVQAAYEGLRKNHLPNGMMGRAGYEHDSALGGGLEDYIEKGYVPYPNPKGNFGFHQDGASLTLEYAYQDWTLAQFAKALGKEADFQYFSDRSENYKNQFDAISGWMRPKDVAGNWKDPFDPYQYENGFNESNAAQSTWFVPHDIHGLAELMGGPEKAVEKLNRQFETAASVNFTSGTSHDRGEDPNRAKIPVNYGNQPSIQTAFVFNHLGRPDLTQFWSREVIAKAFSGLSPQTGYNGDEDQGLMGALAVLMKIGLFQMNGGTEADPAYELGYPWFDKVTLSLNRTYFEGEKITIEKTGKVGENDFFRSASWNGMQLDGLSIRHGALTRGGRLVINR